MNHPDYLVIGTVCQDWVGTGFVIGGTVAYSGLTALSLGRRTAAISSFAEDFQFRSVLSGMDVMRHPSPVTTTYENVYLNGHRQQYLRAAAQTIQNSIVPPSWRSSRIVHIGPLAQEVDANIVDLFPNALIGITPQGWMRQWDASGRVTPCAWRPSDDLLRKIRVLVMSEEDVGGDLSLVRHYARFTPIVVVTSGWKGSSVYLGGEVINLSGRDTQEVDPTGAGDIYAAAYMVRLDETGDAIEAARFANCVASFSVARRGIAGIPTAAEIAHCRTLGSDGCCER